MRFSSFKSSKTNSFLGKLLAGIQYVSLQLAGLTGLFLSLLKMSAILLKYPTYEGGFFMISWANL